METRCVNMFYEGIVCTLAATLLMCIIDSSMNSGLQ